MKVKSESEVDQSYPTVHGIFQAGVLEWGAIAFSISHPNQDPCTWDFTGGPVVKNPPCNAGDAGSTPGRGTKVPHAVEQLSLSVTTTEPACSGAQVPHSRAHTP